MFVESFSIPSVNSMNQSAMEPAAMSCVSRRNPFRRPDEQLDMAAFCRFAHAQMPTGTAAHLAAICGATVSTAEKWLRGETRPSAAHLAALISFFGPAFLAATMPGTRPWAQRQARDEERLQLLDRLLALHAAE